MKKPYIGAVIMWRRNFTPAMHATIAEPLHVSALEFVSPVPFATVIVSSILRNVSTEHRLRKSGAHVYALEPIDALRRARAD
jgi:hypothetical protein